MPDQQNDVTCPHCGIKMKKWETPDGSTWDSPYQLVCFNDECPYFVKGWTWMKEKFNVRSSYRHRHNPATGGSGPLPVWSYDALKTSIIEDDPND